MLGHGAWGLDVADLDPAFTGLEVVVAANDRIAVFRASDLELLRIKSPPEQPAAPNGVYGSPRRLRIAEIDWSLSIPFARTVWLRSSARSRAGTVRPAR